MSPSGSLIDRLLFTGRNLQYRQLFNAIRRYAVGNLLDVGGGAFYSAAKNIAKACTSWTSLEMATQKVLAAKEPHYRPLIADGCALPFRAQTFESVLCIQVLEHTMHPLTMLGEIGRMLTADGHAILLIPQTSVLHHAPNHFYNFTYYWITRACKELGLDIVEYRPLGGFWSTMASHLFFLLFKLPGIEGFVVKEWAFRRKWPFVLLCPFMVLFALVAFPVCLFLSLGDMREEANNHLVVVRRKPAAA